MKGMMSSARHRVLVRNRSLNRSAGVEGNSADGKYHRAGVFEVANESNADER